MEDKRRNRRLLAAASAAALAAITILLLLYVSGRSGRKHDEIVLPDAYTAAEEEQPELPREQEAVLTVTADNVQVVLQSMTRLTAYHQTFAVTRRSGTQTRAAVVDIWTSGTRMRARISDAFETKNYLTDGQTVFLWYEDAETPVALAAREDVSFEALAGLPTYEDLIAKPAACVREGGFLADGADKRIYVRTVEADGERQYWVSTDSGLLYRQTTTVEGTVVYEAEQTFLEELADGDETLEGIFQLPDGSAPF